VLRFARDGTQQVSFAVATFRRDGRPIADLIRIQAQVSLPIE